MQLTIPDIPSHPSDTWKKYNFPLETAVPSHASPKASHAPKAFRAFFFFEDRRDGFPNA